MPLSFHLLSPPHDAVSARISADDLSTELANAGVLLVFRLDNVANDLETLTATASDMRRQYPGLPFVIWPDLDPVGDALVATMQARTFGIRAAIANASPDPSALRRQLTDTTDLPQHVARWAECRWKGAESPSP